MRNMARLYVPLFLMLGLATAFCVRWNVPIYMFMREPQVLGRLPWYAGLFSVVTVWLWCATATACLLAWSVLRARPGADRLPALLRGLFAFRHEILKSDLRFFASAVLFIGLSVLTDVLQSHYGEKLGPWRILFEDGFKLLGAAGWLGYFSTAASRSLRLLAAAAEASPSRRAPLAFNPRTLR